MDWQKNLPAMEKHGTLQSIIHLKKGQYKAIGCAKRTEDLKRLEQIFMH